MAGIPSIGGGDAHFDEPGAFVPEHLPEPGDVLSEHRVLTGDEHCSVHAIAEELFEERGVYDMTFGYNLARLNRDTRHESAGFRYAEAVADVDESDADGSAAGGSVASEADPDAPDETESNPDAPDASAAADAVLWAVFTPTTAFCPQTRTLTVGAFRAWNGLADRHDYDLVRVRAAPMHERSVAINQRLADLETTYAETGELPDPDEGPGEGGLSDVGPDVDDGMGGGFSSPF